jgi:hypothetical protein
VRCDRLPRKRHGKEGIDGSSPSEGLFVYPSVRKLFALVWLLAWPRRSKKLEILLLRHELAMLRRQARPQRLTVSLQRIYVLVFILLATAESSTSPPPRSRTGDPTPPSAAHRLQRRDLVGGLIHEYNAA